MDLEEFSYKARPGMTILCVFVGMYIIKLLYVVNTDNMVTPCHLLPRAHAQGVKQLVCPSVVVVIVGTKIARSRVLGVCACCKHNQSVDIVEKLVSIHFELLKIAY